MYRKNPGTRASASRRMLLGFAGTALLAACGGAEGPEEPTLQSHDQAVTTVTLPIRINVGGGAFTDINGRPWEADRGYLGGQVLQVTDPIAGTTNDSLYQSIRMGDSWLNPGIAYEIPVPGPGIYTVQLLLMEPDETVTNREMRIIAEGTTFVPQYKDLQVPLRAYTLSMDVAVRDGALNLELMADALPAVLSAIEVTASKWKWLGLSPQASNIADPIEAPSLALDANNRPFVAWEERPASTSTFNVYAARWTGSAYELLGGSLGSSTWARNPTLLMDPTGAPVVAFLDSAPSSSGAHVRVRRWNGTAWTEVGGPVGVEGQDALAVAAAMDGQGRPVLAAVMYDRAQEDERISVFRFDGTTWVSMGDILESTSDWNEHTRHPVIAVDPSNRIVVAWDEWYGTRDFTLFEKTHVFRREANQWVRVGTSVPNSASSVSERPSLALSPVDGTPWVAYLEDGRVKVVREQSGAWVPVAPTGLEGWPGMPHDAGPPLLRMDAMGTPTVALVEGGRNNEPRRFIRKFNGTAWIPVDGRVSPFDTTFAPLSGEDVLGDMALALSTSGQPVVALFEQDPAGPSLQRILRVRTFTP
ncbi:malectin domain-containing carbohydrate-binding protein [Corallococcus soli]